MYLCINTWINTVKNILVHNIQNMLFILREILRENMVNVIFLGEYSIEMVYICRPFDWLVLEKLRLH